MKKLVWYLFLMGVEVIGAGVGGRGRVSELESESESQEEVTNEELRVDEELIEE